jgi:hypothetical protein
MTTRDQISHNSFDVAFPSYMSRRYSYNSGDNSLYINFKYIVCFLITGISDEMYSRTPSGSSLFLESINCRSKSHSIFYMYRLRNEKVTVGQLLRRTVRFGGVWICDQFMSTLLRTQRCLILE